MRLVVWFFHLTPYSFPTLPVKYKMLQLCFIYPDLLRIEHPLIWYALVLHRNVLAEILLIKYV